MAMGIMGMNLPIPNHHLSSVVYICLKDRLQYQIIEVLRLDTLRYKNAELKTADTTPRAGGCIVILSILVFAALFSGCSTVSKSSAYDAGNTRAVMQPVKARTGHPAVAIAENLKGRPYLYGGVTPAGFDCSGLVHYAYLKAGVSIPRTTRDQYRISQRLPMERAKPGDLLFFRIDSRKLSHVGLYTGDDRFIHASTKQNRVAVASLNDLYWRKRLIGVGRIH
ncbi:MAG: C40 family peptidase [Candidatus Thiodiazotropha sp.]